MLTSYYQHPSPVENSYARHEELLTFSRQCEISEREFLRVHYVAEECLRQQTRWKSRLVVTEAREVVQDGKRRCYEGHKDLPTRIFTNDLDRMPTYTRNQGDHMKLFMSILLDLIIKLDRIQWVWKPSRRCWELPKNTNPTEFHRDYADRMLKAVDNRPELWRWCRAFIEFLHEKIPPWPKQCAFKWKGFWMTRVEIKEVVTKATYHYGLKRQGYRDDEIGYPVGAYV